MSRRCARAALKLSLPDFAFLFKIFCLGASLDAIPALNLLILSFSLTTLSIAITIPERPQVNGFTKLARELVKESL